MLRWLCRFRDGAIVVREGCTREEGRIRYEKAPGENEKQEEDIGVRG